MIKNCTTCGHVKRSVWGIEFVYCKLFMNYASITRMHECKNLSEWVEKENRFIKFLKSLVKVNQGEK
jgi:hypothetical protein